MLNYRDYKMPLRRECFSFLEGFCVFIEIQKKLKLYESALRDTKTYLPDIFCV
jgi:hypothetical protein